MFIKNFVKSHPLACVLIVALLLRLAATFWSKGHMASDDHYYTVAGAFVWLQSGLTGPDGHLSWFTYTTGDRFLRFPLYNLSLYGQMRLFQLAGIESLDTMMYGIRLTHALLSLLTIWCTFQIINLSTGSRRWAFFGGLFAAVHFVMPYLAVRNLIEMVGGHFWLLALWFLYRYRADQNDRHLFWAGIITGLAWMIRFQIAFAAVAVPFALWWMTGRFRPAGKYILGVSIMVLAAGLADYWLLGKFMVSNLNHLMGGLHALNKASFDINIFIYPLVFMGLFIPPFSVFAFGLCFTRQIWRDHAVLICSFVTFIVFHYLTTNRQERFMIPMIGPLIVLIVIAIHSHFEEKGFWFRHRRLASIIVIPSVAVNFALLPMFTLRYGHKAEIEPLVQIEKNHALAAVLFVDPHTARIYPLGYGGFNDFNCDYVCDWSDFDSLEQIRPDFHSYDYYVLYPSGQADLKEMVDSVTNHYGPIQQFSHVPPSMIDSYVNSLKPQHNKRQEAWVYRPK